MITEAEVVASHTHHPLAAHTQTEVAHTRVGHSQTHKGAHRHQEGGEAEAHIPQAVAAAGAHTRWAACEGLDVHQEAAEDTRRMPEAADAHRLHNARLAVAPHSRGVEADRNQDVAAAHNQHTVASRSRGVADSHGHRRTSGLDFYVDFYGTVFCLAPEIRLLRVS